MTIEKMKLRDASIVKESGVKVIARLIGFNEIGAPIELVYDGDNDSYNWQVDGEYVREASSESLARMLAL